MKNKNIAITVKDKEVLYRNTQANYDNLVPWHIEKYRKSNWQPHIDLFMQLLPGPKVLELGFGASLRHYELFRKYGCKVDGVDYSKEAVRIAQEKYALEKFYHQDFRELDLGQSKYHGIWACASVMNLDYPDFEALLKKLNSLLFDKGIFYFNVKEKEYSWNKKDAFRVVPDKSGDRAFQYHSEFWLEHSLNRFGFEEMFYGSISNEELQGREQTERYYLFEDNGQKYVGNRTIWTDVPKDEKRAPRRLYSFSRKIQNLAG